MVDVYGSIERLVEEGKSFCIVTILEKTGSAPREKGAKMLVRRDFSIEGTIGGGIIEAMAIKLSGELFKKKCSCVKSFSLSNEAASSAGMICGGSMELFLEYVDVKDESLRQIYAKACELREKNEDFVMISRIGQNGNDCFNRDKWLCTETGFFGSECDEAAVVMTDARENFKSTQLRKVTVGEKEYLVEPVISREAVYIFGAGHISQKLSKITSLIDFDTVVLDDRSEFANRERFEDVSDLIVIPSFDNLSRHVDIDSKSYAIIVTRGHAYDAQVLSQMLRTNAKYIGMIGSKTKIKMTYEKLREEGFSQNDIERVYAPIGLDINAQTPEEIAVSIAAQLIAIRRGGRSGR